MHFIWFSFSCRCHSLLLFSSSFRFSRTHTNSSCVFWWRISHARSRGKGYVVIFRSYLKLPFGTYKILVCAQYVSHSRLYFHSLNCLHFGVLSSSFSSLSSKKFFRCLFKCYVSLLFLFWLLLPLVCLCVWRWWYFRLPQSFSSNTMTTVENYCAISFLLSALFCSHSRSFSKLKYM